jgi:hypothetical protein
MDRRFRLVLARSGVVRRVGDRPAGHPDITAEALNGVAAGGAQAGEAGDNDKSHAYFTGPGLPDAQD